MPLERSTSRWASIAAWRRAWLSKPLALVLAASVLLALRWLAYFASSVPDVTFPESAVAMHALEVAQGASPYRDWRTWPHAFAPYGPLTYYPAGLLTRLAHRAPTLQQARQTGRILSLLSVYGIALAVIWGAWRAGVGWIWGVAGLSLALGWLDVWKYCASYRPDAPRTLFAVLAVLLLIGRKPSGRRVALALALLWVSFWFKPSAFGVLLALLLWIGLARGWRVAALAGLVFGASGLALFALLDWHWGGMLRLNVVDTQREGVDLFYLRQFAPCLKRPGVFFMPIVSGVCVTRLWKGRRGARLDPLAPLLLATPLSLLNAVLQSFKIGADMNYFMEPLALSAVAAGWMASRLWRAEAATHARWREALLWLLVLPWVGWNAWQQASLYSRVSFKEVRRARRVPPDIVLASGMPGPVLDTKADVNLAPANRDVVLDYHQYRALSTRGLLDVRPLRQRLERRYFSAVLLPMASEIREENVQYWSGLYGPGFLNDLEKSYREASRIGNHSIWLPKAK